MGAVAAADGVEGASGVVAGADDAGPARTIGAEGPAPGSAEKRSIATIAAVLANARMTAASTAAAMPMPGRSVR